jgi:hypothetical protein
VSYTVIGLVRRVKLESDSDIHLVLADPESGATMVAEIPAPFCAETSRIHDQLAGLRVASMHLKPGSKVRVAGVAFFDREHGQEGAAPNGIELHPVFTLQELSK